MTGSDRDSAARGRDGGSDSPGERARDDSVDRPRAEADHRRPRLGVMGRTRTARRLAVLLCLVAGGLALWSSAPASALIHHGHVFSFAIEGEKTEKLSKPSGVAVNESTGDVYVVDTNNNRVERFHQEPESKPTGAKFVQAWGWGVSDEKAEYETCTTACKDGLAGTGAAQFNSPDAIAIDNSAGPSSGDVYVVSDRLSVHNVVEKFTPSGESLGRVNTGEAFQIGGVAVDAEGALSVWLHEAGEIERFTNELVNKPLTPIHVEEGELFGPGVSCWAPGFAVDADGQALYVNHQREDFEEECPAGAPSAKNPAVIAKLQASGEPPVASALIKAMDLENTSAVAVDQSSGEQASGDVYVDNVTSIAAFTSGGSPIQRFGSEAELTKGRGVAVDPQRGEVLVADAAKGRVDVFGLAPPGPPMVDSVSSQNISPTSTRLEAQIDANGVDTHYYFQYGTADCSASPSLCTNVPLPPPGEDIGSGFGDVHKEVTVTGLEPGTPYFYRVIAENEKGEVAEGAQTANTFTTLPNPVGLLPDGREWELVSPPDKGGSGIVAIGGAAGPGPSAGIIEASENGNAITYVADGPIEPEPEGSRSPEGTQVMSTRGPEAWSSRSMVTPSRQGEGFPGGQPQEYQFFSADLSFALLQPWGLTNLQDPPLVTGATQEERGVYRRSNATCEATPATCYQPLVTPENNTSEGKEAFGGKVGHPIGEHGVISGTSDLSHAVFTSEVALTAPEPTEPEPGSPQLYEWSAASNQLQLVSVLPTGKLPVNSMLGNFIEKGTAARNAISADGSRVFWTGIEEGKEAEQSNLYVRDTSKGETLRINSPTPGVKLSRLEEETGEVHFQVASSDGSRVFFTDTVALTAESRLRTTKEGPADLYVCDLVEEEGKLQCNLTDLTVDPQSDESGENADVIGVALGASEDGSSIYFVANGVLSDGARSRGATPGNCARPTAGSSAPGAECHLYVERYNTESKTWDEPTFIATLSQEDQPDWNGSGGRALIELTSRVSPNGRYLAFMSNRSLTGQDNVDASPAAKGARDEQVFLYDAQTQHLVCASCNPSGAQPHGVQDNEDAGEGIGLLVDRSHIWGGVGGEPGRWLAGSIPGWTPLEANAAPYQSRYLSDDGRLFFNGADALVTQDTNGKEDVYQYEPPGVGSCEDPSGCVALLSSGTSTHESAFLDASANGEDVFFLTAAQLVATDRDNNFDVYDARVCTASSPCLKPPPPPPAPCGNEASCRPPAPSPQGFEVPASATFSGPGNLAKQETLAVTPKSKPKPLTKAQKLAKALKSCKKKYKHAKKKRVACEKQAKKKYGPKKASKHKTGKKK
jgi:DNA-binding beta-propeller fold protein YncE